MKRIATLVLGIIALLATGTGCVQHPTGRIADLDPYVGGYPGGPQPLTPRRTTPVRKASIETGSRIDGRTIVIDAGHGGKDPGALGVWKMPEKTITLRVAMKLTRLLEQRGADVITTRSNDTFISLNGRAAMADRHGADLFVSIHADAAKRAGATGTTVYIARGASGHSRKAAQCIAAAFERAGIESRGVKEAGYRVLVGHSRPSVLVECGFLTNYKEARLLSTESYQSKIADAIADGIVAGLQR